MAFGDSTDTRAEIDGAIRLFERHRAQRYGFLLGGFVAESAGGPRFAGSLPTSQLIVERSGRSRLWNRGRWHKAGDDPLESIEDFVESSHARPLQSPRGLPTGTAVPRTVGYLSYELGTFIENVPAVASDAVGLPLAVLSTYEEIDVSTDGASAESVRFAGAKNSTPVPQSAVSLAPTCEREAGRGDADRSIYATGFSRISEAIAAGDIYQANLTRRLVFEYRGDVFDLWCRLTARQPVPYAAFLDLGNAQLVGNSPERFLRIHGNEISTRPIKGTRPRARDREADAELANELSTDPKEAAEHVMIVDLERNDLGRVCAPFSVVVERFASVASFSTVHHLESEVRGSLRADTGLAEVLRATFPGGSITGAPKVRAMEIIAEVEPAARGVYTGAVGWFNGGREADLNIAIRTAIAAGGLIHYGSGGGIVADSLMEKEFDETGTKARAVTEVIAANPVVPRMAAS